MKEETMTVSELITKLQAFSPDTQVNFTFWDDERILKHKVFPIDEVFEIKGSEFAGVYLA